MPHKQTDHDAERALRDGSSGSTADMAVESGRAAEHRHIETPYARQAEPLSPDQKHDQLAEKKAAAENDQEALLDEAIEETFPGSDPISPKHIT